MAEKLAPKKFGGYSHEDPERFLSDFNAYCVYSNIKNNTDRKTATFHLHLDGPAKLWFLSLDQQQRQRFQTVEQLFITKYMARSTASLLCHAEQFQSTTLGHNTLEHYFGQLTDLGRKLNKSDFDVMSAFVNGLPETLKFHVRAGQPETAEEAFNAAKLGVAYGYLTTDSIIPTPCVSAVKPRDTDVSQLQKDIQSLTSKVDALSMTRNRNNNSGAIRCYRCDGEGHTQRRCNIIDTRYFEPIQCARCGQHGHRARNCASPPLDRAFSRSGNYNTPRGGRGRSDARRGIARGAPAQ